MRDDAHFTFFFFYVRNSERCTNLLFFNFFFLLFLSAKKEVLGEKKKFSTVLIRGAFLQKNSIGLVCMGLPSFFFFNVDENLLR